MDAKGFVDYVVETVGTSSVQHFPKFDQRKSGPLEKRMGAY